MFLKSMELKGFKSFADRTHIDFLPGVTCIVGPNGCGKSNIIDAIRWVLGEQSSASLRARRMEDVIFSGTKHRSAQNFASVRLVFSKAQEISPGGLDELSVERILHRSGESTYKINSQIVRLKDLRELFMDTAVGVSGYSLISQGDIDDILKENKQDRRKIFEEASGISLIHYKKEEARRRLVRVEEHFFRIKDILEEIEKRREPLILEKNKALEYRALEKRAREIDLFYAKEDYLDYEKKEASLSKDINRLSFNLESLLEEKESLQARRLETEEQGQELNKEYSLLMDLIRDRTSQRDQIYIDLRLDEERLRQLERELISLDRDEDFLENKNSRPSLEETSKKLELSQGRLKEIKGELENRQSLFDYQSQDARELGARRDGLANRAQELKSEINHLEKKLQELEDKKEESKLRQGELKSSLDRLNEKEASYQAKSGELERKRLRLERARQELDEERAELESTRSFLAAKKAETDSALSSLNRNIELYEKWELEGEKNLLSLKTKVGGKILYQDLKPSKGYEKALEAALGAAIESLDVRGLEGDIFRLAEDLGANLLYELPELSKPEDPRSLGNLSDFVKGPKKLLEALLGPYLVYVDLASALEGPSDAKKLTLAGQRLEGGFYYPWDNSPSLFEISLKLSESLVEKREVEKSLIEIEKEISTNEKLLVESRAKKRAFEEDESSLKKEELELLSHHQSLDSDRKIFEFKDEEDKKAYLEISQEISLSRPRLEDLKEEQAKGLREIEKLESILNSEEGYDLSGLQDQLIKLRLEEAALGEEAKRWEAELENLKLLEEEARKRSSYKLEQKELKSREKDDLQEKLDGEREGYAQVQLAIKELDNKAFSLKKRLDSLRAKVADIEKKREASDSKIYEIHGDKTTKEVELGRLEERRSGLSQEIWKLYELTMLQVKELDISCTEPKSARRKIRQEMQKLEPINPRAPEEFEEVDERHKFLSEQLKDIENSKKDLARTISSLEKKMEEDFLTSFEAIRENFKDIFAHLFRGGQGDILLEDPQDILSSDIIILASPPGKRLQHMNLLSGGEKALTAIALLFAVLRTKPAPFYVLDEIEAALDDINIQRFGNFLEEFSIGSQFILITHRKGTMEFADALYGVSMEEKGISSLVSLKMEE